MIRGPGELAKLVELGRIECADGDVVPVRISERELHSSSVGIHMWLFFQLADESARPWQSYVKVRLGRTRGDRCRAWRSWDLSTRDAHGHPIGGDRARPFHPSRRFARSSRGQEPSPPGQVTI